MSPEIIETSFAVDIICAIILISSLILGAWRGVVYELMAIAGWIVSFLLAKLFADIAGDFLPLGNTPQAFKTAIGFLIIFIPAVLICGAIAFQCKKLINAVGAKGGDIALGAGFGILRGGLLLLAMAWLIESLSLGGNTWWQGSPSGQFLSASLSQVKIIFPQAAPQDLQKNINEMMQEGIKEKTFTTD